MFNSGSTHTVLFQAGMLGLLMSFSPIADTVAHEAEGGWRYPYSCCTDRDCREVTDAAVSEGPDGYVIEITGELIAYSDKRVRDSPDGVFHWCSVAGRDDTRTLCLFVPPRSF